MQKKKKEIGRRTDVSFIAVNRLLAGGTGRKYFADIYGPKQINLNDFTELLNYCSSPKLRFSVCWMVFLDSLYRSLQTQYLS